MAKPIDRIAPMLREMRLKIVSEHETTRALLCVIDKRLGSVESVQKSFKRSLAVDTLLSRLIIGEFEQRIEAHEEKPDELETYR